MIILPPLVLVGAWQPQDIFSEYNKFPDTVQRVSILQLKNWRDAFLFESNINDTFNSSDRTHHLATLISKEHTQIDIEELVQVNLQISDEEMLSRYRLSFQDLLDEQEDED